MQRVEIVGLLRAGKTTLATALGTATGLHGFQTDRMFLHPDGAIMSSDAAQAQLDQILTRPASILEGAQGRTLGPRVAACDTVIWLDNGIVRRALNAVRRRRARRLAGARSLAAMRFWGWFCFGHLEECKALKAALAVRPAGVRLVHLRSYAEVQAFLDSLPK